MSNPFNRGWNRADFLVLSLVAAGQIQFDDDLAFSALDAVDPGEHFAFPLVGLVPATLVSITPTRVFVAVQGTSGFEQWVANFLVSAQIPFPGVGGQVDALFGFDAAAIFARIQATVVPALSSRRLVLLGHSLGGAICQVLANLFAPFASSGLGCFVMGCPRVGDPSFAAGVANVVFRCENTDDPILGLPPVIWAGPGSIFPIPGPPPLATYNHGGTVKTLDAQGNLSDGSQIISIGAILSQLLARNAPTHWAQEYARRLRIGLTANEISMGSGFANGPAIDRLFSYITGIPLFEALTGGSAMTMKVTLFYDYRKVGVTETFYTEAAIGTPINTVIGRYLSARMMLAVQDFKFSYARISNFPLTRRVTFRTRDDFAVVDGQLGNIKSAQGPQALLFRMVTNVLSQARIFLHGFPDAQISGDTYTPSAAFNSFVVAFGDNLVANGTDYEFASVPTHTFADRISIANIADMAPRGAKITPSIAPTPAVVGDTITIGGTGARVIGANGRKRVTFVSPARDFFVVGGAQPVIGTFTPPAYYYAANPQFRTIISFAVERVTTHRVGRPFGLRAGRQKATVALRA